MMFFLGCFSRDANLFVLNMDAVWNWKKTEKKKPRYGELYHVGLISCSKLSGVTKLLKFEIDAFRIIVSFDKIQKF